MEQSSDESLESEDSELNMTRNETGDKKKISEGSILFLKDENGLAQKREKIQEKVSERGRAKSVGRGITWSTKVSPKKTKRSFSMERSYLKTKRGSMEKSESSEKEEELTFLTKMIDTGTRSKYTFHEKYQFKNIGVVKGILKGTAQDHKCKRKSRSRSRSREKDCQDSRKRWRDERWHHKDQTYVKRREQMCQDQKYHGDQSCAQWKEQSGQSKGHSHFRDQDHGENKKIIPCKYFNDFGFCKYNNGHLDLFGIPKLHICASCYYERGEKRLHCQADCYVVDEACMYFNNFGDCEYKSGHLSLDGKYAVCLFVCLSCGPSPSLEAGSIKVKDTCPRQVVELGNLEGTATHTCVRVHWSNKDSVPIGKTPLSFGEYGPTDRRSVTTPVDLPSDYLSAALRHCCTQ